MGVVYNTSGVSSGLVLSLDAANRKSYPGTTLKARYLVVGGGGSGGSDMGGGGGAGGYLAGLFDLSVGTYTVTVGAGGSGNNAGVGARRGWEGASSSFVGPNTNLVAFGGGGGASNHDRADNPGGGTNLGLQVGSGGGASGGGGAASGGSYGYGGSRWGNGTTGQGNNGGIGVGQWYPAGGGGAGGPGNSNPATGGVGIQNDILGVNYFWAGGGGGSGYSNVGGNGGPGGGGAGAIGTTFGGSGLNPGSNGNGGATNAQSNVPGSNAGANTGGGGGGGSHYNLTNAGGNGGSGIVVIRYPGPQIATGGTVTTVGNDTVHAFTSSGTFTLNSLPTTSWINLARETNNATLINGVTYNSANKGSLVFDGTNDHGSIPNDISLRPDTELTISLWFKADLYTPGWVRVLGQDPYSGGYLIFLETGGQLIRALHYPNGVEVRCNTDYSLSTTQFTNAVFTFKMGDAIRSYFNSVASTTVSLASGTFSYNTTNPFLFGHAGASWFDGNIAQILIYNRALTPQEILQNYNATKGRYGL
jgi:hypothetical protein